MYFILKWHSTCFGQYFCPSSGVQICTYSNQIDTVVCTVFNSWWWTERRPETCRVSFQNKINLITLVHLVGFYCRNTDFLSVLTEMHPFCISCLIVYSYVCAIREIITVNSKSVGRFLHHQDPVLIRILAPWEITRSVVIITFLERFSK